MSDNDETYTSPVAIRLQYAARGPHGGQVQFGSLLVYPNGEGGNPTNLNSALFGEKGPLAAIDCWECCNTVYVRYGDEAWRDLNYDSEHTENEVRERVQALVADAGLSLPTPAVSVGDHTGGAA